MKPNELDELKKLKELKAKIQEGKLEDIQNLVDDNVINFSEEQMDITSENEYTGGRGKVKQFRNPNVFPMFMDDEYKKSGFSNAILLAMISFICEVLFIGLIIFFS